MNCDNCKDGQIETFGTYKVCTVCSGEGVLYPCKDYVKSQPQSIWRNQRCGTCNVRENNHERVSA